ncbi:ParB/RepB/Spo0J family partition protein [Rhizobacter sp. SG703]|nr:ParB/RepB/Spo0J family partition protein [Rhizobacter sp. SG703]
METIHALALDQLHESPFNPRRTFTGIDALAANILAEGRIHQPILVRPRPDGVGLEIVFGHRRVRAARFANLDTAPCMVRDMTDAEARSAQVVENLQRTDVHPLEEAEGFMSMIQNDGLTIEDLVVKFGKSRTFIYNRFKLLDACPALRDAYLADELGTEATQLIARLPSTALQEKALDCIRQDAQARLDNGGKVSYRRIHALLSDRFSLELSAAIFDITDADLLPEVGNCVDCWKRSGNAPDFSDVAHLGSNAGGQAAGSTRGSADVCTDPDCFAEKKKVHLMRVVPRAPAAAAPTEQATPDREPAPHVEAVVTEDIPSNTHEHKPAESTVEPAANGTDADHDPPAATPMPKPVRNQRRKAIDENVTPATLASRSRLDLLKRVRERALATERSAFDLRLVAKFVCESIAWRHRATLEGLYDCGIGNLASRIDEMHPSAVALFLLDCALAANVMVGPDDAEEQPTHLLAAAEHYQIGTPLLPRDADKKTQNQTIKGNF